MYNVIKSVIASGDYELCSMLNKLDTFWVKDKLTDDQYTELVLMARENADPTMSMDIANRLTSLEERVAALEKPGTAVDEWPEHQPHKVYHNGDKITFRGNRYICKLPESVRETTWTPADYPAFWVAQKEA